MDKADISELVNPGDYMTTGQARWRTLLNAYDKLIKPIGDHFILCGSGALAMHELTPIDNIYDLDVLVSPDAVKAVNDLAAETLSQPGDDKPIQVLYSNRDSVVEVFKQRADYRINVGHGLHIDIQMQPFNTMTLWGETYETIKADSELINGFGSELGQYRVASVYHTLAMKFRTHPQREKDKVALKTLLLSFMEDTDNERTS